jgi:type VI secretion system protein VasJ
MSETIDTHEVKDPLPEPTGDGREAQNGTSDDQQESTATSDAPADPYAQIVATLDTWLAPIAGESPVGADARYETTYEELRNEVKKLDSPRAEQVDWKLVASSGQTLLKDKSKDVLIAAHLAVALFHTQGVEGLIRGTVGLIEIIDRYWDNLFPPKKRMRGRVGALQWYLDRAAVIVPTIETTAANRPHVETLKQVANKLREVAATRFEDNAPALSPLCEAVDRLLVAIPKEKPKPPPKAATPAPQPAGGQPASAAAQQARPQPIAEAQTASQSTTPSTPAATAAVEPPSAPDSPEDLQVYLRRISDGLLKVARARQKAQPTEPSAYRLNRVALWLTIDKPPAVGGNGRTMVVPLKKEVRVVLDNLASNASWAELLEEAEAAIPTNRLNLDLQRFSARALRGLGEPYAAVRRVLIAELRALLDRLPTLLKLPASDGSPLADDQSATWLEEEVLVQETGPSRAAAGDDTLIPEETLSRARGMVNDGKAAEAVAALQPLVSGAPDARASFRVRLVQADLCRRAGSMQVARALYESLETELTSRQLEAWEPRLAVECLLGYLACVRAVPDDERDKGMERTLCVRLARLEPSLAIELGV